MIRLEVLGTPAPKGSARAMLMKGKPIVIASGSTANQKALRLWDRAIKASLEASLGAIAAPMFVDQALEVNLLFRFERPSGHWGTGRNANQLKPSAPKYPATKETYDVDKLARAVLDSLTGKLFDDDSRIPILVVQKEWCDRGREGVAISIRALATSTQGQLELAP